MATENFSRTVSVPLPKSVAWIAITDVDRLASWVGIIEGVHEERHLEKYSAVLQDRVGPFKLRADLAIDVTVPVDGERIVVTAKGRDRAADSKIAVNATLHLDETSGGTSISVEGSYQVTGRVASMGGGIIRKKGEGVLSDFFDGVERDVR